MYNPEAFGASAKAIEGKRVSYRTVEFVWRAVVSLFGQIVGLFRILRKIEAQSREVGSNRRLGGRAFVEALERVIEFFEIVISTIEPAQRIEGLTAQGWIFCHAQP